MLATIRALPGCADLVWKESTAAEMPFGKMKVRLKAEIVTMGAPDVDRARPSAIMWSPRNGTPLISAPDVVVIDTRNDYEVAIGTFEGAIDPKDPLLPRFPAVVAGECRALPQQAHRHVLHRRHPLREIHQLPDGAGVEQVFHLKGGILKIPRGRARGRKPVAGRLLRF